MVKITHHISSSLHNCLPSPITSSLSGPNILLSTLFSDTPSLHFSPTVNAQVSHPHKTGKIVVLYILLFTFLDSKPEHTRSCIKWQQALSDFKLLLFLPEWNFDSLELFPNNLTVTAFQRFYYSSLYFDFLMHSDLKTWPYTVFSQHILLVESPY